MCNSGAQIQKVDNIRKFRRSSNRLCLATTTTTTEGASEAAGETATVPIEIHYIEKTVKDIHTKDNRNQNSDFVAV